jgi:uncharacterized protein (DUF924 family)
MDDILYFWFAMPASDSTGLMNKMELWFRSAATLDPIVRARFGRAVADALDGKLFKWADTPRGRLALILVLDQFTRHVFRGTPRMYAGDRDARWLTYEGLDRGDDWELGLEERLFFMMPLAHSERFADQERSVAYAEQLAADAPAAMRAVWEGGLARARGYRDVIARFGRFPHRNEVLGRESTREEIEFLEEQRSAA